MGCKFVKTYRQLPEKFGPKDVGAMDGKFQKWPHEKLGVGRVGRLSYGCLWVSCFLACQNFTGISPELTRTSPEFHQNVTIISPEYRIGAPLKKGIARLSNWSTFKNVTIISPECHHNFTGMSP